MVHLANRFDRTSRNLQAVRSPPVSECIEQPEDISARRFSSCLPDIYKTKVLFSLP
jgi:hypothetical protein